MQTYYRLTIDGVVAATPADGFIDNKKIERYMAEGSVPTTIAQSRAKERANIRDQNLIEKVQLLGNFKFFNQAAPGASATAQPTSFSVTIVSERGEAPLVVADELNPGEVLTGVDAIRRMVARSLTSTLVRQSDFFDPTKSEAPGNETEGARIGNRIEQITIGALAANIGAAESLVTIVPIEGL